MIFDSESRGGPLLGSRRARSGPRAAVAVVRAKKTRLMLLLCLALAACRPGHFDRLERDAESAMRDAAAPDDAASGDVEMPDADEPSPGPEDAAADGEDAAPEDAALEDAGADEDACAPTLDGGRELVIAGPAVELARLEHPPSVTNRKLGASAWLGAHRIWSFSETALVDGAVHPPDLPVNYPTAALDGPTQPWLREADDPAVDWRLTEVLTDAGAPQPLLTREPEEIGLAVTSIVKTSPEGELGGLAFVRNFNSLLAPTEVWVAELADGATLAMRHMAPLFVAPEPLFSQGAQLQGGYVKLFACSVRQGEDGPAFPCVVARAPIAMATQRAAYEAYTIDAQGEGSWSADLTRATPVLNGTDGELSVSWNEHLQKFIALHSAYFSNDVVLHTAPDVEGPWTEGVTVTLAAPDVWPALYAREHPGLQQRCGRRLIISHWAPTALGATGLPSAGDVVLDAIDLE